jgi:hypothetical protein
MVIELSDIIIRVGDEVHINRQPTNCGRSYYACVIQTVAKSIIFCASKAWGLHKFKGFAFLSRVSRIWFHPPHPLF